jgi:hypothetical protein
VIGEVSSPLFFLGRHRREALPLFLSLSNQNQSEIIPMFSIIIRNGSANHYASADNLTCAHTIFNALTKTFRVVELWHGTKLISSYNNM